MKILNIISTIALIGLTFTNCTKEEEEIVIQETPGIGGTSIITGHVKHHDVHIPNATVYIKYGATELPGTDSSDFDDYTVASTGDGHYEFEELKKGNYYLYSTGYDSTISEIVKGGVPTRINSEPETVEIDIPVAE